MAILQTHYGKIEVRILKSLFDASPPVYFQEYAKLATHEKDKKTSTHYIVPENITYAIHITAMKGFYFGKKLGFWVRIIDDTTGAEIYNDCHPKACEKGTLKNNQDIVIRTTDTVHVVGGEPKVDVELAFSCLNLGF
jgi:hypothetical protein